MRYSRKKIVLCNLLVWNWADLRSIEELRHILGVAKMPSCALIQLAFLLLLVYVERVQLHPYRHVLPKLWQFYRQAPILYWYYWERSRSITYISKFYLFFKFIESCIENSIQCFFTIALNSWHLWFNGLFKEIHLGNRFSIWMFPLTSQLQKSSLIACLRDFKVATSRQHGLLFYLFCSVCFHLVLRMSSSSSKGVVCLLDYGAGNVRSVRCVKSQMNS